MSSCKNKISRFLKKILYIIILFLLFLIIITSITQTDVRINNIILISSIINALCVCVNDNNYNISSKVVFIQAFLITNMNNEYFFPFLS